MGEGKFRKEGWELLERGLKREEGVGLIREGVERYEGGGIIWKLHTDQIPNSSKWNFCHENYLIVGN